MQITPARMVQVLGAAPKTDKVWEKQFDRFNAELAEMAQMDWDKIPNNFLRYYFLDLAYVDLQPDLFRHLFPACLKYWYETLFRNTSTELGDADFHHGLMRGNVVEKMLSEKQRQSLWGFLHDGFIDRIESQPIIPSHKGPDRVSLHSWVFRFNTLGIVAPIIDRIWETWWNLDRPGKALCAVMYASGLIYAEGENPIYGTWTREDGGGGPYLTEIDSPLFDWAWHPGNLSYLKDTLSPEYILDKLKCAATILKGHPEFELMQRVIKDAKGSADIMQIRIDDLLEDLAVVQLEKKHWR